MLRYQSHKVVEAGRITKWRQNTDERYEVFTDGDEAHILTEDEGDRIAAAADREGGTPLEGFLMLYKDGYVSWAPERTMDDYVLVQEGERVLTADEIRMLAGKVVEAEGDALLIPLKQEGGSYCAICNVSAGPGEELEHFDGCASDEGRVQIRDPWAHRSEGMRCHTCMWYVNKEAALTDQGRCRRHAPNMGGYPVVMQSDWCGDHRLA